MKSSADSNAILQGWNAIAEFLNCDVRTAKRWETERGLPVRRTRRTPGEGRANVYAVVGELEQWTAAANAAAAPGNGVAAGVAVPGITPGDAATASVVPAAVAAVPAPSVAAVEPEAKQDVVKQETDAAPVGTVETRPRVRGLKPLWVAVAAGACMLALTVVVWGHEHRVARPSAGSGGGEAAGRGVTEGRSEPMSAASVASHASGVQELYLHGSYLFEQRTPETLEQAKNDFERAIAKDPGYAPAYAALAKTYDLLREYATVPSDKAYPLAKAAALKAIALDPALPDAHAALGYEEFFWEWNGAAAETQFRKAIALDPNCGIAHHWYGSMLMHEARFEEALAELDRAQVLEPASAGVMGTRAYALGLSGQRDEAADSLQDILTRVPNSAPLHFILALLSLQQPRDIPRYLDQQRRYAELRHDTQELKLLEIAQAAYERDGEQAMWRRMLEAEQRLHPKQPTYRMAAMEATLGMKDEAIRDLRVLAQQHDDLMIGLDIDALMEPLRDDPRFAQLVAQVGLPARGRTQS